LLVTSNEQLATLNGISLVLKKFLKVLTTLTLIVGCYFGYVRLFAIVVDQFRAIRRPDNVLVKVHDSESKKEAIAYARAAFPPGHWSAAEDLPYRYYNTDRGFWIYAQEWERIDEENGVRYDGKRMRLTPFALIMKSRDGKNTKTITSDRAIIDLSEPLSFNVNASGEPLKIKHVHLEPNVEIRDDKSTPGDRSDDMLIGPLTFLDYDDATHQITTDSHVVIRDPDMVTTGQGMLIQLRKDETPQPAGSSSGFAGAERMDLNKDVHVVIRDVGKSGLLPGSNSAGRTTKAQIAVGPNQENAAAKPAAGPTPLDLRCDSKMQVYLPKPQPPVLVGPPAPPAPTIVVFERNVVALRGPLDGRPDQLTCDTLQLNLVPAEKPAQQGTASPAQGPDHAVAAATATAATGAQTVAQSETPDGAGTSGGRGSESKADVKPGGEEKKGLFGDLTLQRARATGHAVWLYLPTNGVKLRCNELIHTRQAPYKPDMTYFRGDRTRLLDIWKVDIVQEAGPDQGKVSGVTHIWTVDATMYDNGNGMDTANVIANGPGRLETQPDQDQPVEKIAIWQDKFYLHNEVGSDGRVQQKIVVLTGNRPCFIDNLQKTSLDSARWITVWLKPKPKPAPPPGGESSPSRPLAGVAGTGAWVAGSTVMASPIPTAFSGSATTDETPAGNQRGSDTGLGGSNFDIKKLWALRDVHLLAPSKTMTARERLEAEFVDAPPAAAIASAAPAKAGDSSSSNSTGAAQVQEPGQEPAPGQDQVAAQDQAEQPPPEPPMVGSADRIWAKVERKPKSGLNAASKPNNAETRTTSSTRTRTGSTAPGKGESDSEIRNVWMWGSVSLHQDPEQGKTKGQDASGEALYLDNRGPNKIYTEIYQRDPDEKTYLPGPLPPARVENEDMKITAAGKLTMNQETDQAWADGPGTLTQRPAPAPAAPMGAGGANTGPAGAAVAGAGAPGSQANARTTTVLARNEAEAGPVEPRDQAPASKPKTRAGRPVSENVPTTIAFSERMEFTGRTIDPDGNPSARADFFGIGTALMEDALLHWEQKMIAFTDRVVPLAQLGAMSKSKRKGGAPGPAASEGEADTDPQLVLLYCYRNAVGVTRKVDPETPTLIEKRRVEADEILIYDRRTGDFAIPGKGIVHLYDRSDNSSRAPGMNLEPENDGPNPTETPRTVTPTSGPAPNRSSRTAGAAEPATRGTASPDRPKSSTKSKAGEIRPLVLTQVKFIKGMKGRIAGGLENDKVATNRYEFFGDIQLVRAKVPDGQSTLDFDRLPDDGIYLTGQTMRVITEPPPVGSPPSAPARDFVKVWERAKVWSSDKSVGCDVITYDSDKDLVYTFGEDGRGVIYAQQHAPGQPATQGSAMAIRINPKTGAMHFIDNSSIQMIDKNTGVRPDPAKPIDPDARQKKPPRRPFRLPSSNIERRGFSGQ